MTLPGFLAQYSYVRVPMEAIDEVGYSSCQFDGLSPGRKVGLIVDMTSNTFSPRQNARHTSKFSGRYRHYHDRLRVAESAGNI
jgi:hypothetical protein